MTTICRVFGDFAQNFPERLKEDHLNVSTLIINVGTVLLARKFNVISIAGGSAICVAGGLIGSSFGQLINSYETTGGTDRSLIQYLRINSLVQSVILSRIVASAIGHPISWVGMGHFCIIKAGFILGVGLISALALRMIRQDEADRTAN